MARGVKKEVEEYWSRYPRGIDSFGKDISMCVENLAHTTREKFYEQTYKKTPTDVLEPRARKVLELLDGNSALRILDIGCSDGTFTVKFKEALGAKEAWGIDISSEAVENAKAKGVNALKVNLEDGLLPVPSAHFEYVFCLEIIEHLFNTDGLLREIHRILTPTGKAIFTTPNLSWWVNRLIILLGYQPYHSEVSMIYNVGKYKSEANIQPGGHLRLFTHRALKELLKLHGFAVIGDYGLKSTALPWYLKVLDKTLSQRPSLANWLVMVVKKAK